MSSKTKTVVMWVLGILLLLSVSGYSLTSCSGLLTPTSSSSSTTTTTSSSTSVEG